MLEDLIKNLKEVCPNVDFLSADLIDSGVINSLDIIKIIAMLEDKYNISISARDIIPDNFINVDAICSLVHNCLN